MLGPNLSRIASVRTESWFSPRRVDQASCTAINKRSPNVRPFEDPNARCATTSTDCRRFCTGQSTFLHQSSTAFRASSQLKQNKSLGISKFQEISISARIWFGTRGSEVQILSPRPILVGPSRRRTSSRQFSLIGAPEAQVGNKRRSVARAETMGSAHSSRRAFDLQQKCRLR